MVVAESYGGDDEPVDPMLSRYVALGVAAPFPPLRVKETPTEAT